MGDLEHGDGGERSECDACVEYKYTGFIGRAHTCGIEDDLVITVGDGFQRFRRSQIAELRPYIQGEDLTGVGISAAETLAGSPKAGDMVARNPKNHADQWLVAAQYFADNFEPLASEPVPAELGPENAKVMLQLALDLDSEKTWGEIAAEAARVKQENLEARITIIKATQTVDDPTESLVDLVNLLSLDAEVEWEHRKTNYELLKSYFETPIQERTSAQWTTVKARIAEEDAHFK